MDMIFWREPIYDGATQTIYVLWWRHRSQVREFVDDLNDAERKKLIRAFHRIGDHGPPQNREKWRQIKHRGAGASRSTRSSPRRCVSSPSGTTITPWFSRLHFSRNESASSEPKSSAWRG